MPAARLTRRAPPQLRQATVELPELSIAEALAHLREPREVAQCLAPDLPARAVDDVAHGAAPGVRLRLPEPEHQGSIRPVDGQPVAARVGHRPVGPVDADGAAVGQGVLDREEMPDVLGDEPLEMFLVRRLRRVPIDSEPRNASRQSRNSGCVRRPAAVARQPCIEVLRSAATPLPCNVRGHAQRRARPVGRGQMHLRPVMSRLLVHLDDQQITEGWTQRRQHRAGVRGWRTEVIDRHDHRRRTWPCRSPYRRPCTASNGTQSTPPRAPPCAQWSALGRPGTAWSPLPEGNDRLRGRGRRFFRGSIAVPVPPVGPLPELVVREPLRGPRNDRFDEQHATGPTRRACAGTGPHSGTGDAGVAARPAEGVARRASPAGNARARTGSAPCTRATAGSASTALSRSTR